MARTYAKTGGTFAAALTIIGMILASTANAEQKSREQRIAAQEVYWSAGDEPPSMDPTKQADTLSYFWLGHIYEGLMGYDKAGKVVPATAESYKVSPDKKTWTFTIRKNAKWQDGKAVTAHDFEFAWKRLVDPTYASEYSFMAGNAALLNAEDIVAKKKPKEELGVKALDDRTLEVKLSRPVPYFDSLMAFLVFFPVRQDIVQKYGDKFSTSVESVIGNGPYKLTSWQKEQSMRMEKSNTYWNASTIKIMAVESPAMVKDSQANFNNFQTGGIDITFTRTPEIIKQAQDAKLKVQTFPQDCVDYLDLNTRPGRPFAAKELRQALRLGVNRSEYVNKIVGTPGYKISFGVVPDNLPGSKPNSTYRKEAPMTGKDADVAAAKKKIKDYLAASKQGKAPGFTILTQDNPRAKKFAEYFQNSLAKLFDTEVKVESVPFKTRLQKTRDGQYDLALAGWCPDYRDAMTYMDLFEKTNDNNTTGWSSPKYDALIEKARNEVDPVARIKLFAEAEAILADEAPVVPTDQNGDPYVVANGLKGVKRNVFFADPDFRFAEWDSKTSH